MELLAVEERLSQLLWGRCSGGAEMRSDLSPMRGRGSGPVGAVRFPPEVSRSSEQLSHHSGNEDLNVGNPSATIEGNDKKLKKNKQTKFITKSTIIFFNLNY